MEHAGLAFDRAGFARVVDRLIALFSTELLANWAPLGNRSDLPVLIVGMPRSGTTLVEQIVSSRPEAGAGGELRFWNEQAEAAIGAFNPAALIGPADEYLGVLRGIAPAARQVTDKMPFNFLWSGLIHAALPEAHTVHCRLDPVDTCLSNYFTRFATR